MSFNVKNDATAITIVPTVPRMKFVIVLSSELDLLLYMLAHVSDFLRANLGSSSENSACQPIRLVHVSDFLRAKLSENCPVIRDSFEKNSVFHEKNGYFNINLQKMHLTVLGFSKKL